MTVQEIIDFLSAGYDDGRFSRETVYSNLVHYAEKGWIRWESVDRLFDIIV